MISKGRRERAESGQPRSRRDVTAPEVSEGWKHSGNSGFVGNVFMEMSQAACCLLKKGYWTIPRVFMGGVDGFNKVGIVKVKS